MFWKDITTEHHGRKARVWAESTPENPRTGEPPIVGYIDMPSEDAYPVLNLTTNRARTFADWYEVELLSNTLGHHNIFEETNEDRVDGSPEKSNPASRKREDPIRRRRIG